MTSGSSKIGKLSDAFREAREGIGLDIKKMADELGIQPSILESIESSDWSAIPSGEAYGLAASIARRLGLDLDNFYVDRAFFFGDLDEKDTRPGDLRRERMVMVTMTTAALIMLGWLLIPAKDISAVAPKEGMAAEARSSVWKKPSSDVAYPVLGEVFPESPITKDGCLVSLRATDTCDARIVMEDGGEQGQTLRMSEPWKLRVKGSFTLYLDNAGVVAAEVAGAKIQHGAGVGQPWQGAFDGHGNWLQPQKPPKRLGPEHIEGMGPAQRIDQTAPDD